MFLLSVFRKSLSSKIVFTFHNTPDPPNRILGYFDDYQLDKDLAEHIITDNSYDCLVLGSKFYHNWSIRLGSNPKKTKLIYMGIDKSFFPLQTRKNKNDFRKELKLPDDDYIITFPSRLIKRKGIFELINALGLLVKISERKIKLFLPASFSPFDSACYQEVQCLIKKLKLDSHVIRPSRLIPYHEMAKVYAASDLVVMPSYYEGLGLAILEAMSTGIPVVATNVPGIDEIIVNNKNGLLVEKQRVKPLCAAIKKVCLNPKLRDQLIKAGTETVTNKFEIGCEVQKLKKIYSSLLNA